MKKRLLAFTFCVTLFLMSSLSVFAAPKTMPDGTVFDAAYYAAANPDVAKAVGTDERALYGHYVKFGKAEGRIAAQPTDAAAAAQANSVVYYAYAQQVVDLCNIYRAQAGLTLLTLDPKLTNAAMMRSSEMRQYCYFDHARPNGDSCFTVFKEYGISYSWAGENIAWNQSSPEEVVTAWMNSPGHRANIMNPNLKKIGVGFDSYYWTQLFTN